jgi:phenylalanyl-tRNA synthetase beta chain
VSDVVLLDASKETGAANQRRLVALYCARESGFEVTHGFLNRLMEVLGVPHESEWLGEGCKRGGEGEALGVLHEGKWLCRGSSLDIGG